MYFENRLFPNLCPFPFKLLNYYYPEGTSYIGWTGCADLKGTFFTTLFWDRSTFQDVFLWPVSFLRFYQQFLKNGKDLRVNISPEPPQNLNISTNYIFDNNSGTNYGIYVQNFPGPVGFSDFASAHTPVVPIFECHPPPGHITVYRMKFFIHRVMIILHLNHLR